MSSPIVHASFSVERTFPAPPTRVFAAFADPELKAQWFHGPDDWRPTTRTLDFREGEFVIRADRALDTYRKVALWDGAPEKPEAQARFTAFDAYKTDVLGRYR